MSNQSIRFRRFCVITLQGLLLAGILAGQADAVVVGILDNPQDTGDGSPVPNESRIFTFRGWESDTNLTAADGNQFASVSLDRNGTDYQDKDHGAGFVWPIAIAEYEAAGTNNVGGTGLGKGLENGDVIRFSFWMSTDASDPLLNEGTWTDSIKFELAKEGATPGSTGAKVLDTGSDLDGALSFDITAGNCDLAAGEASCSSHNAPEVTSTGWTQFSVQYEIDDFNFTDAAAEVSDVVEIRPVMFLGDYTAGEDQQGTAYVDNIMVEVFDDIATANATAIVNPNPGGFVPAAGLAGDFDGDSDVDGADFLKWQRDGLTANDLSLWESGFGTSASTANLGSVPEPSTALLAILAASTLSLARTRRKR